MLGGGVVGGQGHKILRRIHQCREDALRKLDWETGTS